MAPVVSRSSEQICTANSTEMTHQKVISIMLFISQRLVIIFQFVLRLPTPIERKLGNAICIRHQMRKGAQLKHFKERMLKLFQVHSNGSKRSRFFRATNEIKLCFT